MHKRTLVIGAAISSALAVRAAADTYIWDADPNTPGIQDGPGVWNTTSLNWFDGTSNVAWPGEGHIARFAGTAGAAITVAPSINVGQLVFATPGYRLTGGSIVLNGSFTNRIIRTLADAVIQSDVVLDDAGANWSKAGLAKLSFGGTSLAPHLVVGGGELELTAPPTQLSSLVLQGGTLRWNNPATLNLSDGLQVVGSGGLRVDAGTVDLWKVSKDPGLLGISGPGTVRFHSISWDGAATPTVINNGSTVEMLGDTLDPDSTFNLQGGTFRLASTSTSQGVASYRITVNAGTGGGTLTGLAIAVNHRVNTLNVPFGTTLTASNSANTASVLGANSLTVDGTLRLTGGGGGGFEVVSWFGGTGTVRFDLPRTFASALSAGQGLRVATGADTRVGATLVPDNDAGAVVLNVGPSVTGAGTFLRFTGDLRAATPGNSGAALLASGKSSIYFESPASIQTLYPNSAGKLVSDKPLYLSGTGTFTFAASFKAGSGTATNVTGGLSNLVYEGFGTLATNHSDNLPWVWKHNASGQPVQGGSIRLISNDGMTWRVEGAAQSYAGRISVEQNLNLVTNVDLTHNGRVAAAGEHAFVIPGTNRAITKSGPGTLRLDGDQGYGALSKINVTAGGLRFGADPGAGWLPGRYTRDALGNVTSPPAPAPNLSVTVLNASSRVTFAAPLNQIAGLSLGTSTRAAIEQPSNPALRRTVHTRALSLANNAVFDLADQQLAVDYTGTSPLAAIRTWIISAYLPNAGTHWNGAGITSSSAASNPRFALGYGEAGALLNIAPGATADFAGATVDDTTVLVRYTRTGDANLDGAVDFADLVRLAQNYGTAGSGTEWSGGDFDYNGSVDFNDLVVLAQNYDSPAGTAAPANIAADWSLASATVPEPTLLTPALAMLARRRRRPRGK